MNFKFRRAFLLHIVRFWTRSLSLMNRRDPVVTLFLERARGKIFAQTLSQPWTEIGVCCISDRDR